MSNPSSGHYNPRTDAITEESTEPTGYTGRQRAYGFINDPFNANADEFRGRAHGFYGWPPNLIRHKAPEPLPPIPMPPHPITPPPIIPTREYLELTRQRRQQRDYYQHTKGGIRDPLSDMRSRHRNYGFNPRWMSDKLYPREKETDPTNFGFGTFNNQPIHGPAEWHHYYADWSLVGEQYTKAIPANVPLPVEELSYIESHGFTFKEELGSGGFGKVWKITAERLVKDDQGNYKEVDLACKILSLAKFTHFYPQASVKQVVDLLLGEAQLHSTLKHRNIVTTEQLFYIHDITTGFPFCRCIQLMELCDGDLEQYLERNPNRKLDEKEGRWVLRDYASGLQYLHQNNICHLDLKVHNIMYIKRSINLTFKLSDFGLSRRFDQGIEGQVFGPIGTLIYAAPEVLRKPSGWSKAKPIDIYTLGLVFVETLAGSANFERLVKDIKRKTAEDIRRVWGISKGPYDLIKSMLRTDPKKRPDIDQVINNYWVIQQF
ncbi:serine/threonine-protein kinase 33-like [Oppia nitens]|uniref:serine/threonine-protein kinase 33-like n=1 Tax=Oppia nitens TaxID=1686743 RepID=UPI0023DB0701|nr:serine/threonine-protein kinase 33-like [Oppia nitens]